MVQTMMQKILQMILQILRMLAMIPQLIILEIPMKEMILMPILQQTMAQMMTMAPGILVMSLVMMVIQHPKAMVVIQTADRQKTGDYSTFAAKAYYSHSSDTPEGDSTDVIVKISNRAWMHYIDKKLPDALVTDAYHFLPHIGILNPTFDDDGVITKFDFILGSQG